MRYGSVCSGIEAATVAWHPLGWEPAWFSEIEPFPSAVLAHHYPAIPNLGDMTTIAARVRSGEVEAPDLLVGGTPCQSFSVAGLRGGLEDDRGNLAIAFVRLADAIDAVRLSRGLAPAWILWENVPGVFSSDGGRAFGSIVGALVGAEAALVPPRDAGWTDAGVAHGPGRVAAWRVLDAQHFGLAQRRRRVFVLARGGARAWAAADALLPLVESVRRHPAPSRAAGPGVAGPLGAGPAGRGWNDDLERAGAFIPVGSAGVGLDVTHTLRAEGFDASEDGTGRGTPLVPEIAHCICGGPDGRQFGSGRDGQDTFIPCPAPPAIAYALRSDAGREGVAKTPSPDAEGRVRLRDPGFSVDLQNTRLGGDVAGTLDTTRPTRGGGQGVMQGMSVRRLTPRECERLQGFPDDFTAIPGAKDGPRYRALGNSMATTVMRHIGRGIQREEDRHA